ncbi:hypothetical protein C2869_12780 [Saccharobesus litoralis]|uniref:Uncharacterized protein n=1 Tax=Saccharobesus litoralis TaxID=2172099 RepID=A0A2S0VT41_9ALTE|nr:hypothetical protein [Saccharobesus litoralis]AWB67260.1 hypothetical protein C2869_12780 [Saccharobesus litoralis]
MAIVRSLFSLILFGLVGVLTNPTMSLAQPKMHLTEHRILLTDRQPKYDYQFYNQGKSAAQCTTSIIDFNVNEVGQLSLVKTPSQQPKSSAKSFLRASPRSVLIGAEQTQRIKVIARKLRSQRDGEWVSYLSLNCKQQQKVKKGMNLSPNFVFNIPIVVRKGQLAANATFENVKISHLDQHYSVQFELARHGQRSLYGRIDVKDQADNLLGFVKGFSVYQQTKARPLKIALNNTPQGKLKLIFNEHEKFGDIQTTWQQP